MATSDTGTVLDQIEIFEGVAAEEDALLAEFFIRTSAYQRIVSRERFIVVGRKGTGKTAIYRKLQQQAADEGDATAVGLEFSDYPGRSGVRSSSFRLPACPPARDRAHRARLQLARDRDQPRLLGHDRPPACPRVWRRKRGASALAAGGTKKT